VVREIAYNGTRGADCHRSPAKAGSCESRAAGSRQLSAEPDAGNGLERDRDRVPGRAEIPLGQCIIRDEAGQSGGKTDPCQDPGMAGASRAVT
jgi:hypothetical protein